MMAPFGFKRAPSCVASMTPARSPFSSHAPRPLLVCPVNNVNRLFRPHTVGAERVREGKKRWFESCSRGVFVEPLSNPSFRTPFEPLSNPFRTPFEPLAGPFGSAAAYPLAWYSYMRGAITGPGTLKGRAYHGFEGAPSQARTH